ncbi:MAG: hypothetical protein NC092_03295 [Butyrivibrio sp.]|nr:hypothetical protein [Muribaculum sp.]MCM1551699.1 hypothetical protein [Butyrivibrio sp.]
MKKLGTYLTSYFPEILVLTLCAALLIFDISHKKGYHMDELLSFELANAQFNPWIVPTQPQGRLAKFVENELQGENFGETFSNILDTVQDVLQNRGSSKILTYQADVYEEPVWIERQQFIDYVTVDSRDAFNYLSVYFNVKDDNHPPLHFMVLHTVSSVFQGKLSPFMGCGINLVCVMGIMALLMWLGRRLMALLGQERLGRLAGNLAALAYGLSGGALNTTLLIRMYAMLTFWAMALLVIHVRKLYGTGDGFDRKNQWLIVVTVLGFWTQYFFLFYCLVLAAVTAVLLWRWGRKKELVRYVRSMVLAAVIGVACFPFAVSDVFASGRGVEALDNLSAGLSGYGTRLWAFLQIVAARTGDGAFWALAVICVGGVAVILGAVRSGKRTESAKPADFAKLAKRVNPMDSAKPEKSANPTDSAISTNSANSVDLVKSESYTKSAGAQLWLLLILPVGAYFLLAARMSPYLVDRYMMLIFPMVTLILVVGAFVIGEGAIRLYRQGQLPAIGLGLAGGLAVVWLIAWVLLRLQTPFSRYQDNYLYAMYGWQEEVSEQYADLDCICVCEGVGYYGNLPEFMNYQRTLLVTMEELENRKDTASVSSLDKVVVLSKQEDEERLCAVMREKYGFEQVETLWRTREAGADVVLLFTE